MLGHQLARGLGTGHTVVGAVRTVHHTAVRDLLEATCAQLLTGVEATEPGSVAEAIAAAQPEVVLNCIGVIKQLREATDAVASISVNALFPHQLAGMCGAAGARLVHFSTDCVFSGDRGDYKESDVPDATDLYGRSKLLGEVEGPGCLTLRTSIIGRDLVKDVGLLEWFLGNRGGSVRGFRRAVFSGFPTVELTRIVAWLITEHPALEGVYHVASPPIDKYDLLLRIRDAMQLDIEIVPDDTLVIDRSLNCDRLRQETGFEPPDWTDMVRTLAVDARPYDEWRTRR
jgi:dTDP-4-dehydrorhamnose reductase